MHDALEARHVSVHTEISEMASNAPHERGVLVFHLVVSMASTPVGNGFQEPLDARLSCLQSWDPRSSSGSMPKHRETEEVETRWSLLGARHLSRTLEGDDASLLGMEPQP